MTFATGFALANWDKKFLVSVDHPPPTSRARWTPASSGHVRAFLFRAASRATPHPQHLSSRSQLWPRPPLATTYFGHGLTDWPLSILGIFEGEGGRGRAGRGNGGQGREGGRRGGGPNTRKGWGAQNFAFFSFSRPHFHFFLVSSFISLGVFSWNFGGVLVDRDLKCACFQPQAVAEGGPAEGGPAVGAKSAWPDQNRPKLAKLKAVAKVCLAVAKVGLAKVGRGQSRSWPKKVMAKEGRGQSRLGQSGP